MNLRALKEAIDEHLRVFPADAHAEVMASRRWNSDLLYRRNPFVGLEYEQVVVVMLNLPQPLE